MKSLATLITPFSKSLSFPLLAHHEFSAVALPVAIAAVGGGRAVADEGQEEGAEGKRGACRRRVELHGRREHH